MQMRWKLSKVGDVRKVQHVPYSYRLPERLEEGTTVKILSFDHGYYSVVAPNGEEFEIFMMCVKHLEEFLLDGKWLPESDPLVQAEFAKPEHLRRAA